MYKLRIMSPSAISWNSVKLRKYRQAKTASAALCLVIWKRMTIQATRSPDKQPGTSAASNQRRAFLKPPRMAVGHIHSVYDNLPATSSTRASIKASFTKSTNPPFRPSVDISDSAEVTKPRRPVKRLVVESLNWCRRTISLTCLYSRPMKMFCCRTVDSDDLRAEFNGLW